MIAVYNKPLKLIITSRASLLRSVRNFFVEQGTSAYMVGGAVRDLLLHRPTADIDFAVAGDAPAAAARLADAIGGRYVLLDAENGVARVVLPDGEAGPHRFSLDFSTLKGGIESDLARRDFTVNAIALDLEQARFIPAATPGAEEMEAQPVDPFGGLRDIRERLVRATGEDVFRADPARLLRAVRLAAELGFGIEAGTEELIRRDAALASRVAGERVHDELLRLLACARTGDLLAYLHSLGILMALIPELQGAVELEQPREHTWTVFWHSVNAVRATEFVLRRGEWEFAPQALETLPWSAALAEHFEQEVSRGSTRAGLLKLAALVHDVAKPQTRATMPDGKVRFLGHAIEGAAVAAGIMERLRFSAREIGVVEQLVRHHLRPTQMSSDGLPTDRAIYRYFRDTGDTGIDVIFLSLADHLATRGPNLDMANWQRHIDTVNLVLDRRFGEERVIVPPKLIDGHDLIEVLGLAPGPLIGDLLEAVREAQASGEVMTREEALAYIRKRLVSEGIVNRNG